MLNGPASDCPRRLSGRRQPAEGWWGRDSRGVTSGPRQRRQGTSPTRHLVKCSLKRQLLSLVTMTVMHILRLWVNTHLTDMGCMTWLETSGSGARIGTIKATMRVRPERIRQDRVRDKIELYVAVVGPLTAYAPSALRTVAASLQSAQAAASGFVVQGLNSVNLLLQGWVLYGGELL